MHNNMKLRRNRWLLLISRTSGFGIGMAIPTITLYWNEQGLAKSEFFLLQMLFALALVVLEVITGRFADKYGKVTTLRIAAFVTVLACFSYATANSFSDFLIAEILFALGLALNSGTDEAFLFQTCKALDSEFEHQRWWSRLNSTGFWCMAIMVIVGSWIAAIDLSYPYIIAGGLGVLALTATLFMIEPPIANCTKGAINEQTVKSAIKAMLFSGASMRWMILAPGLVSAIGQPLLWIYQDFMLTCGLKIEQFGFAFAVFNMVAALSAWQLRKYKSVTAEQTVSLFMYFLLAMSMASMLLMTGFWAWLVILPLQVIRSAAGILFSCSINSAIQDEIRSTALSVRNALRTLLYVLALMPWWLFVDTIGSNGMLLISLLAVAMVYLILWWKRPFVNDDRVSISSGVESMV